jgi:hypothetical protein
LTSSKTSFMALTWSCPIGASGPGQRINDTDLDHLDPRPLGRQDRQSSHSERRYDNDGDNSDN